MKLVKNRLGYYEVEPKPTAEELRKHYRDKYFDKGRLDSQYAYEYTDEERLHKTIAPEEARHFAPAGSRSLLEIGFGEGFFLSHFKELGWSVRGVDFTDKALISYFPELRGHVAVGDIYDFINEEITRDRQYDLVACNNVLEHVLDPAGMLKKVRRLVSPGGVCRIVVPNDGSWLQEEVIRRGYADPEFWARVPEHLCYFSVDSLKRLLQESGWELVDMLADFPIDVFLLNPDSNYQKTPDRGRNCHFARVAFEATLYRRSLNELIDFRRGCARVGVGRNIIAYLRHPKEDRDSHRIHQ